MQRNKKILHIVGARPQFIKCSLLVNYLNNYKNTILHTNQHFDFDMSDIFFKELKIKKPIIFKRQSHKNNRIIRIASMITETSKELQRIKPDLAIIYGDTDTTLAASIALRKKNTISMHVEAGLRSYNSKMAEEQNRVVADHFSDYLITPNQSSTNNLLKEGIEQKKIFQFGDLLFDQALVAKKIISKKKFNKKKNENFDALMTMHRDENLNEKKIKQIFREVSKIKYKLIWPVHPKMKNILNKIKEFVPNNITLIKPLSYLETINMIKKSRFVLTDSGGVQRESFFLNKISFVLRDRSEWTELSKHNYSYIIDTKVSKINSNNIIFPKIKKKIFSNKNFKKKILKLVKKILK